MQRIKEVGACFGREPVAMIPILKKLTYSPKAFVERVLPHKGVISVEVGDSVNFFDVVGSSGSSKKVAGCSGTVSKVIPGRSVLLETSGVTVQAVFALGDEVVGELMVIGERDKPTSLKDISSAVADRIIVTNYISSLGVLKKAHASGVKAIVCGGIDYELGTNVEDFSLSLLVLNGFGFTSLSQVMWDFFKSVDSCCSILLPERQSLFVSGASLVDAEQAPHQLEYFKQIRVGQRVQVLSWPFLGYTGTVAEVTQDCVEVIPGLCVKCVHIKLDGSAENIVIPVRNVGIL